jgi:cyanophycin synthetase
MRVFRGPSLLARSPVVLAALRHETCPTAPAPQAITRLKAALPGIDVDWPPCSGLNHAHAYALVTARLALAFLNTARGLVRENGAIASGRQDALLWVGYHHAEVSALALEVALHWIHWAALEMPPVDAESSRPPASPAGLRSETDRLLKACGQNHPDTVARILMIAAQSRDIPVQQAPMPKTWMYGWGKRSATFVEASPIDDSAFGTQLARDKFATAGLLKYLGYPHSDPRPAVSIEEAREIFSNQGAPLVVKPPDRGQGRGVTVGVHTLHDLEHAFGLAMSASRSGRVLVERLVEGDDHRLLVVRGKLVAATRREPPSVVGDGQANLRQLVGVLNADRLRHPVQRRYLKQIAFDAVVTRHLAVQGMTPDSTPAPGQKVTLRANANISSGGTPHDVIELVHPEVKLMAESLAANLGLSSLGVDYMTRDISRPWREIGGAVIEINTTPGLDLHVTAGMEEAAIGSIVLGEDIGLIPIVLVICSSDRVEFWERQLTENSQLWPAGTAMLGPTLAHLHSMPLLPQGNLYMRMQRLLANQSVAGMVVVSGVEMVLAEGLPAPFTTLAILDTPFTDERDPERRLVDASPRSIAPGSSTYDVYESPRRN